MSIPSLFTLLEPVLEYPYSSLCLHNSQKVAVRDGFVQVFLRETWMSYHYELAIATNGQRQLGRLV